MIRKYGTPRYTSEFRIEVHEVTEAEGNDMLITASKE
jgi:hypothetical protein